MKRNYVLSILVFIFVLLSIKPIVEEYHYKQASTKTMIENAKNVLGNDLRTCCMDPVTGFYRNGRCDTGENDYGTHVVCAEMTQEFLDYTKSLGNDLCTPKPEFRFPGLKAGDKWCLCAIRWKEAYDAGVAPPVVLESTHEKALQFIGLDALRKKALRKI